jgi:hypothetical protein
MQHYNKKYCEEVIAYFPWYDKGQIINDASNNSSIVACVFVTAVTFLTTRYLPTIRWGGGWYTGTHRHTEQSNLISLLYILFKIRKVGQQICLLHYHTFASRPNFNTLILMWVANTRSSTGIWLLFEQYQIILSRVWRLYETGYWIDNWIYWTTIQLHYVTTS